LPPHRFAGKIPQKEITLRKPSPCQRVAITLALLTGFWALALLSARAGTEPAIQTPETASQHAELDRRYADMLAQPDDAVSWDEVSKKMRNRQHP